MKTAKKSSSKDQQPLEIKKKDELFIEQSQRKYDLVLFGCTGFTGNILANYLAKNVHGLNWAIAGRSQQKLDKVKQQLVQIDPKLSKLPILIADSFQEKELTNIVNSTKVIISTVGPFAKYGSTLVGLCAAYGTHYVDITGEAHWVRDMIEKYDDMAFKSGAIIINCCGVDSIPWDILTFKIAQQIKQKYGENISKIEHFNYANTSFSGGSLDTVKYSILNPPKKSNFGFDPLLKKSGQKEKFSNKFKNIAQRISGFNKFIGEYVGMQPLVDGNAAIVKRSCCLLNYSENLKYYEGVVLNDFYSAFNLQVSLIVVGSLLIVPFFQNLMYKHVFYKPGEGPSQKQLDKGFLTLRSVGKSQNDRQLMGIFKFPNDPCYVDTARMAAETGLSLVYNYKEQQQKISGFHTPASGLGDILVDRLVKSGCELEILEPQQLQLKKVQ